MKLVLLSEVRLCQLNFTRYITQPARWKTALFSCCQGVFRIYTAGQYFSKRLVRIRQQFAGHEAQ